MWFLRSGLGWPRDMFNAPAGAGHPGGYLARRRAPRRVWDGRRGTSPAETAACRCLAPYCARAAARAEADGLSAITSTLRPNSSAVLAVCGPMTAMTVTLCGL